MQDQNTARRSIMLNAETHAALTAMTKRFDCTYHGGVEALLSLLDDEITADRLGAFIENGKIQRQQMRKARRELAAKVSNLSDEEVVSLIR